MADVAMDDDVEQDTQKSHAQISIRYAKLGSAGIKGGLFQINLLTMFMLNALEKTANWRLSTENKVGAKFDDIIFECSDEAVLLQAKYKQKSSYKITEENLFSVNSKSDDFSLPKYFFSYHEVKRKFKRVKSVILCTNAAMALDQVKTERRSLTPNDMLYFEGNRDICYTFQKDIIARLEQSIRVYQDKNLAGKNILKDVICEENIRDFLKHLQFITCYPSDDDLKVTIEDKISRSKFGKKRNYQITYTFLFEEMVAWFEKDTGIYMNPISSKSIFSKMVSYKFCEYLENYEVFFDNNDLIAKNNSKVIHVTPRTQFLLYIIKIYRALLQKETLFVPPTEEEDVQFQIIDAFEHLYYKYLVLIRPKPSTQTDNVHFSKIKNILNKDKQKRVILIAQREDTLANQLKDTYNALYSKQNYRIMFSDLSKDTKKQYLNKTVIFQGDTINIRTLLPTTLSRNRVLTCDVLAKLARRETVIFGKKIERMGNVNYFNRTFRRPSDRDIRVEEDILTEKLTLISDSAGMGKSTVLKRLAAILKKDTPHIWVIPVDLNCCTKVLKDFQVKGRVDIRELLNCQESTTLQSDMEMALFSVPDRIALMVDGVDEISPYYTDSVLKLLSQCKEGSNFKRIVVTTRPHLQQELEHRLEVSAWNFIPFSASEQMLFLQTYWSRNMDIQDPILEDKCKYYAEILVNNISKLTNDNSRNNFSGNPLQTRMLAEVFQENSKNDPRLEEWEFCRDFVMSDRTEPKLPKRINFVWLYQLFIEKKRTIFVEEKGNPNGNVMAEEALKENFKQWYDFHHVLAVKHIVESRYHSVFTSYGMKRQLSQDNLLKVGIVEAVGFSLRFVHRTFAEYFVAECIVNELKRNNKSKAFYEYLFGHVFTSGEYSTVRLFLDDFLGRQSTLALGTNSLFSMSKLIFCLCLHLLAQENHAGILRFICTNISCTQKKFFKLMFRNKVFDVDCKNINGCTPLHVAAASGHMDSLRYLVEQGASVDNSDRYGNTPLLKATRGCYFDVVKYLVQKGADVNCTDNLNNTPLLEACRSRQFTMAWFLVQKGANPNVHNNHGSIVLHHLVYTGQLKLVKRVLEIGVEINAKNQLGGTALHVAVNSGHLPMVELLATFGADLNAANEGNWVLGSRFGWEQLHQNRRTALRNRFVYDHMGGFTPLLLAVAKGDLKSASALLEYGASADVSDRCGCTPLHVAARKCDMDTVKILIANHADPNKRDKCGRTALHEACYCSTFSMYDFLVLSGADHSVKDVAGRTPFEEFLGHEV